MRATMAPLAGLEKAAIENFFASKRGQKMSPPATAARTCTCTPHRCHLRGRPSRLLTDATSVMHAAAALTD